MRYLQLKRRNTTPRADGTAPVYPLVIDSPRKFAPYKERKHTVFSAKKCHLIYGAHDSGKTRWLTRLHGDWQGIWGARTTYPPVYLSTLSPISTWTDAPHVADWHDNRERDFQTGDPDYRPRFWDKLNQQQRADLLPDYLSDTRAVLMLDDAHKLTGRKLQIARQCVICARIWLVTASQENRLPPNLRPIIDRREPQRTRLLTDASYDATGVMVWFLIVAALGAGWWEASLILGGLKMLGTGRRAARPD